MESAANEFFVGFSTNGGPSIYQNVSLKLFISTPEPDPVSFTVVAREFHFNGSATIGSTTEVNLPRTFQVLSNDITEKIKEYISKLREIVNSMSMASVLVFQNQVMHS